MPAAGLHGLQSNQRLYHQWNTSGKFPGFCFDSLIYTEKKFNFDWFSLSFLGRPDVFHRNGPGRQLLLANVLPSREWLPYPKWEYHGYL